LVEALQDEDGEVRSQVALALGEWGGAEAARSLAELLRVEQNERVCQFGIAAPRTLGGPAALEGLNTALLQGSEAVRGAAMEAIEELATGGRIDDSERPPIGAFQPDARPPAADEHISRPGAPRTRGSLGAQSGKPTRTRGLAEPASAPGEKVLAALRSIRSNSDEPDYLRERADELVAYLG
jgi:HEAT repeat protein